MRRMGVRLVFVTGKGGVGKTTVAAALGLYAAQRGRSTLIIETASDGQLVTLFERRALAVTVHHLSRRLDAVRVNPRRLVEDYFTAVLRFRWLSERLFSSGTFNAVTTAVPGITEFLLLEKIREWLAAGSRRRGGGYDLVIVDGPASGHALKLFATPRRLGGMVSRGPLGTAARSLGHLLGDAETTRVLLVSLPEEMAVRETLETHEAIEHDLGLRVAAPVVNRVFLNRFTAEEARVLNGRVRRDATAAMIVEAARFAIASGLEAERHLAMLQRALATPPIILPLLFTAGLRAGDLGPLGQAVGPAVLTPA
jgi:anion-transporting  ArsA/GET3 family ATPase